MEFHIIHDDNGTFVAYLEDDLLVTYATWALADAAITGEGLVSAFVVEAQPDEKNVDDAEVATVVAKVDTDIQTVVESVGIRWSDVYKTGKPGSLPPFLPKHSAERKLYTELVAKRTAFADLTA